MRKFNHIKIRREELGWSQEQLGEKLGLSQPTVQRMESRGIDSVERRKKVAKALKMDVEEMINYP